MGKTTVKQLHAESINEHSLEVLDAFYRVRRNIESRGFNSNSGKGIALIDFGGVSFVVGNPVIGKRYSWPDGDFSEPVEVDCLNLEIEMSLQDGETLHRPIVVYDDFQIRLT